MGNPNITRAGLDHEKYYLSLCVLIKDEDRYIREWVAFHLSLGVDFILVVDNGKSSSLGGLLKEYVDAGKVKILRYPPRPKTQREVYNRALRFFDGLSHWVGFFDIDEFVFPVKDESLPDVLSDFEQFAGLAVNWVSFGSSGHKNRPEGWVTENFLDRGPLNHTIDLPQLEVRGSDRGAAVSYRPVNSHLKCFVKPSHTLHFRTAHHFKHPSGYFTVDEQKRPVAGPFSENVSVSRIRANHYWSKSLEELSEKIDKGRVSQNTRRSNSGYDRSGAEARERASRGERDTEILRLIPEAKQIDERFPAGDPEIALSTPSRLRFGPRDWLSYIWQQLASKTRKALRSLIR